MAIATTICLLHGCSVLMTTPPPPEAHWDTGPVVGCSGLGWVIVDGVYGAGHLVSGTVNTTSDESHKTTLGKVGLAFGTLLLASTVVGAYRASRCSAYHAHRNGGSLDCATHSDCAPGWRCGFDACEPHLLPSQPEGG